MPHYPFTVAVNSGGSIGVGSRPAGFIHVNVDGGVVGKLILSHVFPGDSPADVGCLQSIPPEGNQRQAHRWIECSRGSRASHPQLNVLSGGSIGCDKALAAIRC